MKDETRGLAIEEFVVLKVKMYSFFVDSDSKHIKAKGVNKNAIAIISQQCPRRTHNRLCNSTIFRPNTQQFSAKRLYFRSFH